MTIFLMIGGAPNSVAPFIHAVETDDWVFMTGQLPFSGTSNISPYPEGIEAQTRQGTSSSGWRHRTLTDKSARLLR
jgi:enamine deaminase RidA (YjgF/YER057c/UK114 family)